MPPGYTFFMNSQSRGLKGGFAATSCSTLEMQMQIGFSAGLSCEVRRQTDELQIKKKKVNKWNLLNISSLLVFPAYFDIVDFLYGLWIFARGGKGIHSVCGYPTNSPLLQEVGDLQETAGESWLKCRTWKHWSRLLLYSPLRQDIRGISFSKKWNDEPLLFELAKEYKENKSLY